MPTINKPKKKVIDSGNTYDEERRKIYSSERWRRLRAWKFSNDPLCERCLQEGKVVPAEDIHHIISFMSTNDIEQRRHLAYDYGNLMSLCKQCHQSIHNSRRGNG